MVKVKPASARPALQDASNQANQATNPPAADAKPVEKPAKTTTEAPASAPKANATAGKKRKSETSLDDDIAAYKQDLSHISTEGFYIDMKCN
ncbi:uncharacterized protein F4812DRAFT_457782 [Daldinia caldariorum]|uniref:uncharacterized protein n=1 Tax=Daldinia caldariorum TaxID=326644 RepID=UPI002007E78C|nr:uncharacterized protein F4812DRAFT_457782 [Daldinia caldariorum]KAI1469243.1 hypothetical protein F4812DRAFT_457782 [Daldinia caldariorum]